MWCMRPSTLGSSAAEARPFCSRRRGINAALPWSRNATTSLCGRMRQGVRGCRSRHSPVRFPRVSSISFPVARRQKARSPSTCNRRVRWSWQSSSWASTAGFSCSRHRQSVICMRFASRYWPSLNSRSITSSSLTASRCCATGTSEWRRLFEMSEFWTGELNDPYAFDANVGFYDTTLRDGEQTVGVVLTPEDKLELARGLDELGIERIEAGFPRVSDDDRRAVELIRDAGLNAEVWGFSRAVEADVKVLVELGVGASVIESPISDLKLEALGVDREAMLERIVYAVSFAAEQGVNVAFFGVDGTRADPGFFETVYKTAVEAGAREVVVVDTIGIATPEAVADLVGRTREWLGHEVAIHFHGHNDFGLATAAAA